MPSDGPVDGRRLAGERTRQRLLDATLALMAERGSEDAVGVRDIADAARANVAAIKYHFGSKDALCRAAAERAFRDFADDQLARLVALPDDAGVAQIVATWGRLLFVIASGQGEQHSGLLLLSRLTVSPPPELREPVLEAVERPEVEIRRRLRRLMPELHDDDVRLRLLCVRAIFSSAASGGMRADLHGRTPGEVEERLVPLLTSVLTAPR